LTPLTRRYRIIFFVRWGGGKIILLTPVTGFFEDEGKMIPPIKPLSAAILLSTSIFVGAAGTIQIIAVNNGEGRDDGESYFAFTNPVLNESGQVAFVGFRVVGGFGEPDGSGGIYVGGVGTPLVELIGVGDPGFVAGSTANSFVVGGINDKGQVAYSLSAISATGDFLGTGLYLDSVDSPRVKIVEQGDLDPDGDSIRAINFTDLDSDGRIGLRLGHPEGEISNAYRSTVIFESGGLRVLAKEDQPAPDGVGIVAGAFFPCLNDAGQIHYGPRIDRPGLEERPALFRETPGTGRELLFRSDDPAFTPGLDGTLLLESYTPSMNEAGTLVFAGSVSGAVDVSNDGRGLFTVGAPSSVVEVAREGQNVPGGDTMAGFSRASLNESGDVAFYALLTDDPAAELEQENVGLYLKTAGGVTEIAREGQAVPGGDGKFDLPRFFGVTGTPRLNTRPGFNDSGQVVFLADLTDTSTGGADDQAIFFYDGENLVEIVRTGSPMLGSSVVDLGLEQSLQNDSDEEIGFNDSGQIAFRFALQDDREGIAIWTPDSSESSLHLSMINTTQGSGYDFEWDSQPGMTYDLVTSTSLDTQISQWEVYDPDGEDQYRNIVATGSKTMLMSVPGDGVRRFFAVIEKETLEAR